jgi:hypothetical protein
MMLTVALADTPFKKLTSPRQYKLTQHMGRLTELTRDVMMMLCKIYPASIHLPTGILLNIFVERKTPVMAPSGDNSNDKPKLPSVNASLCLMPGMAATHVPNSRLLQANKKPTATTGFNLMKEEKFLKSTIQIYSIAGTAPKE